MACFLNKPDTAKHHLGAYRVCLSEPSGRGDGFLAATVWSEALRAASCHDTGHTHIRTYTHTYPLFQIYETCRNPSSREHTHHAIKADWSFSLARETSCAFGYILGTSQYRDFPSFQMFNLEQDQTPNSTRSLY